QPHLLIGAAGGGNGANTISTVARLDRLETPGGESYRLLPGDLPPGVGNRVADHGRGDAILVGGVAKGEAPLHTGMPVVGLALLPGSHAHHRIALHIGLEAAAHAAVGAGGDDT